MEEIAGKIIDNAEGAITEIYRDGLKPTVQPLGEVLGLLPRTLRVALNGWEKWLVNKEESLRLTAEAVREKANAIPEGKQVEPEPYVAIPAIQQNGRCIRRLSMLSSNSIPTRPSSCVRCHPTAICCSRWSMLSAR